MSLEVNHRIQYVNSSKVFWMATQPLLFLQRLEPRNILSSAFDYQTHIPTLEVLWLTLLTFGANQHAAPRGNMWRWSRGWCHVRYWVPGFLRRSLLQAKDEEKNKTSRLGNHNAMSCFFSVVFKPGNILMWKQTLASMQEKNDDIF